MTQIHSLTASTVLRAEMRTARYFQMNVYRGNLEATLRADAPYFPHRIDALGLYRMAGVLVHPDGNLLEGFYVVDDFGQLVRVPFSTVLALLPQPIGECPMYTESNHPARRRRRGDRPTEPLTFDEPAEPLTFDEPAAQVDELATTAEPASDA